MRGELGGVVGSPVREDSLRQVPHPFIRIEFGSIGRKSLEPETGEPAAELADGVAFVNPAIIPEDDHGPAQVTKKMAEKPARLRMFDVLLHMKAVVEAEAVPDGTHGDARDDRDLVPTVAMAVDWRHAAGGPCSLDAGHQQEPTFIYEDEVGPQPTGVFFTRGQSRRFHRSMAGSSRSTARRAGF